MFVSFFDVIYLTSLFFILLSGSQERTMTVGDLSSSTISSPELHVLAVDDSFVDRKVIERLLRISACKGNKEAKPFLKIFLFSSSMFGLLIVGLSTI